MRRSDDLPYNPNREIDGRFGSGPHKQRPKVGREPAAAKPEAGPHPHVMAARAAVNKAKADPSPKNIKAARQAVAKAKETSDGASTPGTDKAGAGEKKPAKTGAGEKRPAKSIGDDELTTSGNLSGETRATKPEHGLERIQKAEASSPRRDGDLIDAIGNGGVRDEHGRLLALNAEAQAATRGHFAGLAQKYGMPQKQGETESEVLHTRSVEDMGACAGLRYRSGKIEVNADILAHLGYHAQDMAYDPHSIGDKGTNAYQVMMHETVHSHGPNMYKHDEPAKSQLAEEMSTEMAARHITTRELGVEYGKHEFNGYGDIMDIASRHVMDVTGLDLNGARDALGRAALELKKYGGVMHPDAALESMARGSVFHAGEVWSGAKMKAREQKAATADLHKRFQDLATEMNKRYPWP